ncbi:putative ABC transport system ATP-binding protein [Paenibacillus taihuensis]|uniref:Putative ABC transport system ATP-binding protein n=1 Tax=Paenibacillus taihuensis TaxID=1156355 RepID=A0A3D9RPQ9_9BACL|nr:ABC transporter ATP-binding protein [Paenibacillus taihuensis]REE78733.1 putative ABC transport system ATP-binding protein [Paenibacillus taihuensis]
MAAEDLGPLLEVRHVHKSFPVSGSARVDVLKGIELTIEPGKLTMLRGRSGSGKTTLLNLLGGLDRPTEGEIVFRGSRIDEWSDKRLTVLRRKEIGFVFQSFALLPLLTAWENVELSLRMAGTPRAQWKERTDRCLELVGLAKRAHHRPFELSGGEQQRVAIAKAIAHRPALLLADEPTAELDTQMAARIIGAFRDIIGAEQIAICMTTHDSTLWEAADVVYQMADGRIVPA